MFKSPQSLAIPLHNWLVVPLSLGLLAMGGCASNSGTASLYSALNSTLDVGLNSKLVSAASRIGEVPVAFAYLRMGKDFESLLILGERNSEGYETWYGADDIVVIMRSGQLISSQGLPGDIEHSYEITPSPWENYLSGRLPTIETGTTYVRFLRISSNEFESGQLVTLGTLEARNVNFAAFSGEAWLVTEKVQDAVVNEISESKTWLEPKSRALIRKEIYLHRDLPRLEIEWFRQHGFYR